MLSFEIDLEGLLDTVEELGRCGGELDALLDEVTQRVAGLRLTWSGSAANAQAAAQAEWEAGFRDMRAALADMRAAAHAAHGSYSDAAATNLQMWRQVR